MISRPMLSPGEDPLSFPDYFKKIQLPLLGSPKFDGIRCVFQGGVAYSRTMKMLPSNQLQSIAKEFKKELSGVDCEIIIGDPCTPGVFNLTQSHIMSANKPTDDLKIFAFDNTSDLSLPFYLRLQSLIEVPEIGLKVVGHKELKTVEDVLEYESEQLELGFEGVMLRDPFGPYKQGRGTFREGLIYKLKRFQDGEGVVVDVIEGFNNTNESKISENGLSKRSYASEGLVPSGRAGKLILMYEDELVEVAMGAFNAIERKDILNNFQYYKGKLVKFRFMRYGAKDKLRFPRAVGFRDEMDL